VNIDFRTLAATFKGLLEQNGFNPAKAGQIADVFAETTFDGVFSHGINRFPRFIRDIQSGIVDPLAEPEMAGNSHALEQWDGHRGAGISNALHCTDRAIGLADTFGIGCVGLRNTSHWMRGGTYGWKAAEKGFIFMGWTNTIPNMPPWNGHAPSLGNNPFILAIPHVHGHIVLDMAMSQYSYGKLEWYERNGTELPEFGGFDREHRLTKDPSEILATGRILPIGLWKGTAFSLVLDLAAAILSGGNTSREIGELNAETALSQIFIAVDPERFMGRDRMDSLIEETLRFNARLNPSSQYPGQRSQRDRKGHHLNGIDIPDPLWEEIGTL
jgi:3-dehydro-L-gulonate 2-dehydrogenase